MTGYSLRELSQYSVMRGVRLQRTEEGMDAKGEKGVLGIHVH